MKNKYSHYYTLKYNGYDWRHQDIIFDSTHKNVSQVKFHLELWIFLGKSDLSNLEKQALFNWDYVFISHVVFSI